MIYLKQQDFEKIVHYARAQLPYEACGLLGGIISNGDKYVREVYLLTNLDKSSEHFTMDPREQLQAVKDIRAKELSLLGNFHSHPETPSRPSEEDIRLAYDSDASYFIVSLMEEEAVLRSFHIEDGKSEKEVLIIQK